MRSAESYRAKARRERERYAARRKAGQCGRCGGPDQGAAFCEACAEINRLACSAVVRRKNEVHP